MASLGNLEVKRQATWGMSAKSKTGRGLATVPIFILVPQVKLPKRLSLEGPAREAEARLPGLIVANWEEGRI